MKLMWAIIVLLACGLMTGCVSAPREREAHCLAVAMADTWQAEQEVESAEREWRRAQQARAEIASARPHSLPLSTVLADWYASSASAIPAVLRTPDSYGLMHADAAERALYERVVTAHERSKEAKIWYGRVARRVHTRIEEDDMLYPVLGTLATSTAIVLYPLVRWNVRSVLWEGEDPDSDRDPVQVYCAGRLDPGAGDPGHGRQ